MSKVSRNRWIAIVTAIALLAAVLAVLSSRPRGNRQSPAVASDRDWPTNSRAPANAPGANTGTIASQPANQPPLSVAAESPKRLFDIVRHSDDYEWTAADGKDTNVMRRLAHNDGEFERMLQENPTIYRRQLVYHKIAFSTAAQREVHFSQPIIQLTLPGLDGLELQADVIKSELEAGGDRGTFTGRLVGREQSMVTVAFIGGREAFTVISPQDGIYLTAEPRDPGELIVKSIDYNSYGGTIPENDGVVVSGTK